MPSGKTHDRLAWLTSPISAISIYQATQSPDLAALGWVAHVFSGLYLSPDLDLQHSRPFKRWGILKVFWWPYAKAIAHRGISHVPLLGTATRLLWMAIAFWPVSYLLSRVYDAAWLCPGVWLFVALEIAAATHYVADSISSFIKKRR